MKKAIVFALLGIFLLIWGFGFVLPDAGYVLVILGQKTVETSLWFACFAVVALAFAWFLFRRFVRVSWNLAQRVSDFFVFGSFERASKRAASGMVDLLAGDWLQARKKLLRTASKVESPLVNYLAAARASFELGDAEDALKILHDAQKQFPTFAVPIGAAQAKMELQQGRVEQARLLLVALQQKDPKNPQVLAGLAQVYIARNDWLGLSDLLPQLKKSKVMAAADLHNVEVSLQSGLLKQAAELSERHPAIERLAILRRAFGKVPSYLQRTAPVVAAYAKALMHIGADDEAESLLRKTLAKSWDDSLTDLYGLLRVTDVGDAIKTAESWLKYYPQNAALLRALGRLSLRNQLWGLARDYFQRSLAVKRDAETYAELARLLGNLGDPTQSLANYQAAIQLWVPELPELPQPIKG